MDTIARNIETLHKEIPSGVELVAVSKFHHAEAVLEAYNAGQRLFGESRVQELIAKIPQLPADIRWHFIGHLQSNKVRAIIGKTALIESIDTEKLLRIVDDESRRAGVITNVLMQLHVAREETKFGFSPAELSEFFARKGYESLTNTHICGVMGMASNTDDQERVHADFRLIADTFRRIREEAGAGLRGFDTLSMGMSGDWQAAVHEGSNLVRIGSAIFGPRQY